jgi:hypothetical protein
VKVLAILGNGLSVAMLRERPRDDVDLVNLFKKGGEVCWPATGLPGFLSYQHCPNLWALGARQTASSEAAYSVIEQVITAVNACCFADPNSLEDSIYVKAYRELVAYLRYLFVHYDEKLVEARFFEEDSVRKPIDWLIKALSSSAVTEANVVTFNYDAFLERSLQEIRADFSIPLLDEKVGAKLKLHKPHGSITFCGRTTSERSAFDIKHEGFSFSEGDLSTMCVKYSNLGENYPTFGMLPPAGDSDRYKHRWILQIWNKVYEAAAALEPNDIVLIYGLSYWHVDRREIDVLLSKISRRARVVSINPRPNINFEAACCSLFRAYQSHSDSSQIARMIP